MHDVVVVQIADGQKHLVGSIRRTSLRKNLLRGESGRVLIKNLTSRCMLFSYYFFQEGSWRGSTSGSSSSGRYWIWALASYPSLGNIRFLVLLFVFWYYFSRLLSRKAAVILSNKIPVIEFAAGTEFHNEEETAFGLVDFKQSCNVGMVQLQVDVHLLYISSSLL